MRENGKPMLPTAEEAEALTPTIRKEMTARGATKVSITYNRSAGLEAFTVSNGEEALEAVAGGPLT